jgi:hypothetical protein
VGTLGNAPRSCKLGRGGIYGEMQRAKGTKEKIVNDNYRTCNNGPSGARAIIVRKGGKATLVVH